MYTVYLINFGYSVWSGPDRSEAIAQAKKTGFECAIYGPGHETIYWSPISGLRVI